MVYVSTAAKAFLLGTLIAIGCIPSMVYGQVISEIMYDPAGTDSGREWIEIHNTTTEDIDLTAFTFFESNVNHGISYADGYTQPSTLLAPGAYAVIADNPAKFLIDWPQYTGMLFDSAFSLVNTGEELRLNTSSGISIHTTTYTSELGAKNTGASLQLSGDVYIAAEPTPGTQNATVPSDIVPNAPATTTAANVVKTSSHNAQVELTVSKEKPTLPITAGRERVASTFVPVPFQGFGADADNRLIGKVSFLWNFGDGTTAKGPYVSHTYRHPGTYHVVLNAIAGGARAVARTRVSVFEPVAEVMYASTTITITNHSSTELNIGGFLLTGLTKRYEFPKDTIISPAASVPFDRSIFPELASSTIAAPDKLQLLFPNKKPVPAPKMPMVY